MATSYRYFKREIKDYLKSRFDTNSKVLDVGVGDGTYYDYLHDYFDEMYGVEVFEPNIIKYHLRDKYKLVYCVDIKDFEYEFYDIIIFGDIIEHLTVEEAQKVLKYAYDRCKEMIVAVPYMYEQGIAEDNVYEIHKQPDLTNEVFLERYPYMECIYRNDFYGYYKKKSDEKEEKIEQNNNQKKVSVIIPVYNQEELVIKCLDSIPKRNDIEIIVVNDASTDKTLENLKNYKKNKYKDLKIITYKTNKGVSYARNKGLDNAKGTYVIFVDSDDYLFEEPFNQIVSDRLNGEDIIYYDMENNYNMLYYVNKDNRQIRVGMFKFIKRDFIGNLRFTIGKNYAEDKEFTLKLLEKKPLEAYTGVLMYHYNYPRTGSLSYIHEHKK